MADPRWDDNLPPPIQGEEEGPVRKTQLEGEQPQHTGALFPSGYQHSQNLAFPSTSKPQPGYPSPTARPRTSYPPPLPPYASSSSSTYDRYDLPGHTSGTNLDRVPSIYAHPMRMGSLHQAEPDSTMFQQRRDQPSSGAVNPGHPRVGQFDTGGASHDPYQGQRSARSPLNRLYGYDEVAYPLTGSAPGLLSNAEGSQFLDQLTGNVLPVEARGPSTIKNEPEDEDMEGYDIKTDHRKRKRNRTIRSCVPCHNHKRKVGTLSIGGFSRR